MLSLSSTGRPIVWVWHCGRLKHTSWQHGYKLTRVYLYIHGGLHITQLKLYRPYRVVKSSLEQTSRDVVLNILSRSRTGGTDVSVSNQYRHSNVSVLSRSRHSNVSSQSQHHTSHLQPWWNLIWGSEIFGASWYSLSWLMLYISLIKLLCM